MTIDDLKAQGKTLSKTPPQSGALTISALQGQGKKLSKTPPTKKILPQADPNNPAFEMGDNSQRAGSTSLATVLPKSLANTGKSIFKFAKGVADFLNPTPIANPGGGGVKQTIEAVKEAPDAIRGLKKDSAAAAESEQNEAGTAQMAYDRITKLKSQGKDTTRLETLFNKLYPQGVPKKGGFAKAVDSPTGRFLEALPEAITRKVAPHAVSIGLDEMDKGKSVRDAGYKALQSVAEDPAQLAPLILGGDAALDGTKTGAVIDSAVKKTTDIVTKPVLKGAKVVGKGAGALGSQALGLSSKTGAESVKQAFEAGKKGGDQQKAFTDAMRGKTSETGVVENAYSALSNLFKKRSEDYKAGMEKVAANTKKSFDISPITKSFSEIRKQFNVNVDKDGNLDFSRSPLVNDKPKVEAIYNILKDWGRKPGDRTVVGIDLLKRQLRQFRETNNAPLNTFIEHVVKSGQDIIKDVPGYKEVMGKYGDSSDTLQEIQKDLSMKDKATVEQGLNKLTQALRNDKQLRVDLIKELEQSGDPTLLKQIAGLNMKRLLPNDIFRGAVDVYAIGKLFANLINPVAWAELASTSPRLVGEFVNLIGRGMGEAKKIGNINPSIKILPPAKSVKKK